MPFRYFLCVLLAGLPNALAQTPDPCATAPQSCATLIETHATSQTRIPNSAVDVEVSIVISGKDLATVQRALSDKSGLLLTYLVSQKAQRLITSRVSFFPQMKYDKSTPEKTVAYNGNSNVSFRTTPEKLADILAGVLTNGADSIRSTKFTPTEEELAEAQRKLSEEATRLAVSQANSIANAAGMHVLSIRNINVSDSGSAMPRQTYLDGFMGGQMKARSDALQPVDTAAGEDGITVRVDITAAASSH